MKDERQLIDRYVDGELSPEEESRLAGWLAADGEHIREFVRETHLHRQLREAMLARRFQAEARAAVQQDREKSSLLPARSLAGWLAQLFDFPSVLRRAWLPLAACLLLMAGAGAWFFGPTRGEPVLAGVQGTGFSLERAGQPFPASDGTRLQSGDVLRTPENVTAAINFAPEKTWITIQPGTELRLAERTRSKRFFLRLGTLEASVARQRPFRAMVIVTPHAEARVLGTKFTLAVETDASTLEVTEGKVRFTRASDGAAVKVTPGNSSRAATNVELSVLPATGYIRREYWTNLANNALSAAGSTLKSKRSLVAPPDGFDYLQRFESMPLGPGVRFTERIRGYVQPPKTGLYRLALTTVHVETVLLLSWTDRPEDVVQVAYRTPDGNGPSLQEVTPVPLQAGRKYYVEVVHESDGGDDQLAVSWQAPGGEPEIIPGKFLSPFPTQEKKGQR